MADIYLDIEWGEQPFAFGEDAWPAPLIRPEAWPENPGFRSLMEGTPKVTVSDDLLARWRAAFSEFRICQEKFQQLAREHGMLQ